MDHITDPQLEDALNRHRLGDSYAAIYPQLPADFPSDEDIEAAALNMHFADEGARSAGYYREMARAALLAVADARRTEEEG